MNKLITIILSSFFTITLIWFFQGYIKYGDDIVNYRIDFKGNLENYTADLYVSKTIGDLQVFYDKLNENTIDIPVVGDIVQVVSFFGTLLVGIFPIILFLLCDVISFIIIILNLLFNPKFIPIY